MFGRVLVRSISKYVIRTPVSFNRQISRVLSPPKPAVLTPKPAAIIPATRFMSDYKTVVSNILGQADEDEEDEDEEDGEGELDEDEEDEEYEQENINLTEDKDDPDEILPPDMYMSIVGIRRVQNVLKGGRIMSYSVNVVVGNGGGGAGFGTGKSDSAQRAAERAVKKALKAMTYVPRYAGSTIFNSVQGKADATTVVLWPLASGSGLRANPVIQAVYNAAGIINAGGKVIGSKDVANILRATFKAFTNLRDPIQEAKLRGVRLIDLSRVPELHRWYKTK